MFGCKKFNLIQIEIDELNKRLTPVENDLKNRNTEKDREFLRGKGWEQIFRDVFNPVFRCDMPVERWHLKLVKDRNRLRYEDYALSDALKLQREVLS